MLDDTGDSTVLVGHGGQFESRNVQFVLKNKPQSLIESQFSKYMNSKGPTLSAEIELILHVDPSKADRSAAPSRKAFSI